MANSQNLEVTVLDSRTGDSVGKAVLDAELFGITPNVSVMHQVVTAQLGAKRQGSHNTKTRSEVRGGSSKPWRQKGTGRARHGSIRSPQWRGGGVAHGPKPRDYSQRTPKKMVRLALRSALSDRAASGDVIVVNDWNFEQPKTSEALQRLATIGADGRVLVVLPKDETNAWRSFANLQRVHTLAPDQINCYDIMVSDVAVFTEDCLPSSAAGNSSSTESIADSSTDKAEVPA